MIKTIKLCLYKSIRRNVIAYCDLLTLVSDIQKAINSHPLTYRCSDIGLDIIAPVNFISPYIKEELMLKAAEDESTTFTNPPSNSEVVNSLQLRDHLLQKFTRIKPIQVNIYSLWNYPSPTIARLGIQKLLVRFQLTLKIQVGTDIKGLVLKRNKVTKMTLICGISLIEVN